jgi:bifunctional oligoribonuclease and PAP phosphatase NrnA
MKTKKIIETITRNKTFLLGTHLDVEGDALGSALGMYLLLKRLKKKVYFYHPQIIPENYRFLPYSGEISSKLPLESFDAGIILDCSDISRLGQAKNNFINTGILINIDHHISNTKFAELNYVEPGASSASELVYKIYKKFFNKVSKNAALCLYTGIFTDTGSFSYTPTTSSVHRIAAELIESGVKPANVYYEVYSAFESQDVAFIGNVLSGLKQDNSGKIVWVNIESWRESVFGDLTEVIFHNLRSIKRGEVFVLIKNIKKNEVRVNFRSNGKVNVDRIAKFFGGGGHKNASGVTIKGESLSEIEKKVISFIRRCI